MVDHCQWATWITLARVPSTFTNSGTYKHVRYLFDVACVLVHLFALVVCDDRHINVLDYVRQRSIWVAVYVSRQSLYICAFNRSNCKCLSNCTHLRIVDPSQWPLQSDPHRSHCHLEHIQVERFSRIGLSLWIGAEPNRTRMSSDQMTDAIRLVWLFFRRMDMAPLGCSRQTRRVCVGWIVRLMFELLRGSYIVKYLSIDTLPEQ